MPCMDALSERPRPVSVLSKTTGGASSAGASGTMNALSETEMTVSVPCNATVVATSSFRKRMQAPRSSVANCCRARGRSPSLTATPHVAHTRTTSGSPLFLPAAQNGQQVCHSVHIHCSHTYISIVAELSLRSPQTHGVTKQLRAQAVACSPLSVGTCFSASPRSLLVLAFLGIFQTERAARSSCQSPPSTSSKESSPLTTSGDRTRVFKISKLFSVLFCVTYQKVTQGTRSRTLCRSIVTNIWNRNFSLRNQCRSCFSTR